MSTEERILELLAEIDYRREMGSPVGIEELCEGDTTLCAALCQRLLERGVLDEPSVSPGTPSPEGPFPLIKGYTIMGQLGQGRLGIVYQARDSATGQTVALKLILCVAFDGPTARADLDAKLGSLRACRHPHLVGLQGWGNYEGCPFLVQECCLGGSLEQRLQAGLLPLDEAVALVEELARALHHAHRCGFVHGHLTPHHVLFAEPAAGMGEPGVPASASRPRIADLGLVPLIEASKGPLALPADRLPYRAPERDGPGAAAVHPAVDIYSLGAILHRCLAGRAPATLAEHCRKCLKREPARRYASAADLADDLARFRAGRHSGRPAGGWPAGWRRLWDAACAVAGRAARRGERAGPKSS